MGRGGGAKGRDNNKMCANCYNNQKTMQEKKDTQSLFYEA